MGLRGPAPKPTVIEEAEGRPGKRALNRSEPQFARVAPKCPSHLSPEAKKRWREICPVLLRARLLTEGDQMALANLCQAYATMAKAQKELNRGDLMITSQSGYAQQNPLFTVIRSSMEIITKLCREFGLTPSARSRMSAGAEDKETDPLDDAIFSRSSELLVLPRTN
jgi:P27 family predicted phage terminase small subunit